MNLEEMSTEELLKLHRAPVDNLSKQRARGPKPPAGNDLSSMSTEELLKLRRPTAAAPAVPRPEAYVRPTTDDYRIGDDRSYLGPLTEERNQQFGRERGEANAILQAGGTERDLPAADGGDRSDLVPGGTEEQRRYMRQYLGRREAEDTAKGFAGVALGSLTGPLLGLIPGASRALSAGGAGGLLAKGGLGAAEGVAGSLPTAEDPRDLVTGGLVGSGLRVAGTAAKAIQDPKRATGRTIQNLKAVGAKPGMLNRTKGMPAEQADLRHGEAGTAQLAERAQGAINENIALTDQLAADSIGADKKAFHGRLPHGEQTKVDTTGALDKLNDVYMQNMGSAGPTIDPSDLNFTRDNLVTRLPAREAVPLHVEEAGAKTVAIPRESMSAMVPRGKGGVDPSIGQADRQVLPDDFALLDKTKRIRLLGGDPTELVPTRLAGPGAELVSQREIGARAEPGRSYTDIPIIPEVIGREGKGRPGRGQVDVPIIPEPVGRESAPDAEWLPRQMFPEISIRELDALQRGLNDRVGNPAPGVSTAGGKQAQGIVSQLVREQDPLHGPDPDTIGASLDRFGKWKDQTGRMRQILHTDAPGSSVDAADRTPSKELVARGKLSNMGRETTAGHNIEPYAEELATLDPVAEYWVRQMKARNAGESLRLKPPNLFTSSQTSNVARVVMPGQNMQALAIRYGIPLSDLANLLAPLSGAARVAPKLQRAQDEIYGRKTP